MVTALQTGLTNVQWLDQKGDTPYLLRDCMISQCCPQVSLDQGMYMRPDMRIIFPESAYLFKMFQKVNGKSLLDNIIFTYGSGLQLVHRSIQCTSIVVASCKQSSLLHSPFLRKGLVKKVNGTYKTPEGGWHANIVKHKQWD